MYVWAFYDAPLEFRNLSNFGGGEDWIIIGTTDKADLIRSVAQRLAVGDYEEHTYEGFMVIITAHA